jgi:pimeloyl-ACP methyl ester carboxylesterase
MAICYKTSMSCRLLLLAAALLAFPFALPGEQRMIGIGGRRIAVYCEGASAASPTVVLVPAGGRPARDWTPVQPGIAAFTRVCSYDHANTGSSDKAASQPQPLEEVVDDLHAWLQASGEKGPFVLVGHSISGLYIRRFSARYPRECAGLVFVDSAHEEQALRLHELDPQGPAPDELLARLGFFVKPGQRLEWRTGVPLIVLAAGQPKPRRARDGSDSQANRMTEEQFQAWDRTWREFQQDLAGRSAHGQLRIAQNSGHWIQRDEPDLVVQAIRDVIGSR